MQSDSEHSEFLENNSCVQIQPEEEAHEEPSEKTVPNQEHSVPLTGYELVADMLRRQDEVIAELDALNLRIESAIKEISDARKLDEQAADQELANAPSTEADSTESACKAA